MWLGRTIRWQRAWHLAALVAAVLIAGGAAPGASAQTAPPPWKLTQVGFYDPPDPNSIASAVAVAGTTVYLADGLGLLILDVRDPAAPARATVPALDGPVPGADHGPDRSPQ